MLNTLKFQRNPAIAKAPEVAFRGQWLSEIVTARLQSLLHRLLWGIVFCGSYDFVIATVVIVIATLLSIFAKIDSGVRILKDRAAQAKYFCSC